MEQIPQAELMLKSITFVEAAETGEDAEAIH